MSERLKNSMRVAPRVQNIFSDQLLLVDDGNKEIGRDKQQSPAEVGRRYTDDSERMLVQPYRTAYHASVVLKMAVPIRIGEHEIRRAAGPVLIGGMEELSKIRLNSQHVEVVPTRRITRRIC